MTLMLGALLGAAALLAVLAVRSMLWSFAAQRSQDYAAGAPVFDMRTALQGPIQINGVIHDLTGRTRSRFTGRMEGAFTSQGGVLDEVFDFGDGADTHRRWRITYGEGGRFTATADDVIGDGHGRQEGNAVRMRYRLRLSEAVGGHVLDVTDWMYLLPNGVIINRSEMRKFGLKVAELTAAMTPVAVEAPS